MLADEFALVESVYASWANGDLAATLRGFSDGMIFAVRAPVKAASFVGEGSGKLLFASRLQRFLDTFDIVEFEVLHITPRDDCLDCRIRYHYRHKLTGMDIDGTMRHMCRVVGSGIVHFEVIHDAQRMGAFFDLVERASGTDGSARCSP